MPENAIDARKKREELKAKRNLLFQRFLKNLQDIHLALRIKRIDDRSPALRCLCASKACQTRLAGFPDRSLPCDPGR